jgi:hypothetical protein
MMSLAKLGISAFLVAMAAYTTLAQPKSDTTEVPVVSFLVSVGLETELDQLSAYRQETAARAGVQQCCKHRLMAAKLFVHVKTSRLFNCRRWQVAHSREH